MQAGYCSLMKVKVTMQYSDIISFSDNPKIFKSTNQNYRKSTRCRAEKNKKQTERIDIFEVRRLHAVVIHINVMEYHTFFF